MKTPINVIHIADKLSIAGATMHGVTRLFSWLFPRFNNQEFRVKIIELRNSEKTCEYLRSLGIDVEPLGLGKFDVRTAGRLAKILRNEEADIVHLHGYGASNFGRIAARLEKKKCIIHEHFVDPNIPGYQIPIDFFFSSWCDLGIAICQSVKDFMVAKRHFPESKVRIVFNGVPLKDFVSHSEDEKKAERRRWGVDGSAPIIGSIGRLDKQKGNKILIEAARILLERGHDARFIFAGDGPLREKLEMQAEKAGIEEYVVFTGHHDKVSLLQSIMSLQVFPSLWEGTTLTVFEAMAMSVPVVASDIHGLGEVLDNGKNALLVPPGEPNELANAIERCLTDTELAQKLARQGKKDSSYYDIHRMVQELQNTYREILMLTKN